MTNENNLPVEENQSASTESERQEIREIPDKEETPTAQETQESQEVAEVNQKAVPPPTETHIPLLATPEPSDNIQIEILNVRVFEPEDSVGVSILKKKLVAELNFRISGTQAKILTTEHHPFQTSFYTVDLRSKNLNLVACEEGKLKAQKLEYTIHKEFPVPKPGRYEFHTIVLLLPPHTQMKSYQGPILSVVP